MNSLSSIGNMSIGNQSTNLNIISGTYSNKTYQIPSYNVYFFSNPTTPTNVSSNVMPTDASAEFNINVPSGSTIIYYLMWGGGGAGGGGNVGGGGGSSGDLVQGSITLSSGTYNCKCNIGGGGRSIGFVASGNYTTGGGTNGYGAAGGKTTLNIINNILIDASGGCPGGPSSNNNGATSFSLGGGCGTRISGTTSYSGSIGTKYNGGGNPLGAGGGGGGASAFEAGISSSSSAGVRGGKGVASSTLNSPFNNFSNISYLYSNGSTYFCEGGGGASVQDGIESTSSFFGIGGNGGYRYSTTNAISATSGVANTGSGGGAILYGHGTYSGTGANGGIIIAFK